MNTNLNQMIDHTALKAFVQEAAIEKLCAEAMEYGFASVCINPCNIPLAKRLLAGSDVKVCTVIGFPLGANTAKVKAAETADAYEMGCDEFDMVINVGALKDGKYDYVREEIRAVVEAARGKTVKVIIETLFLAEEEKVKAVQLASEAGAHFVKTCTGFNEGVATAEDIALMRRTAPAHVQVKASAGIRTYVAAKALIAAGADRIGTSAGAAIVKESENG